MSDNLVNTQEEDKSYKKKIIEAGLFFPGFSKGSFILPPYGCKLWENIKELINRLFVKKGVQNVQLPSLIPLKLFEKEKQHIQGFKPELYLLKKKEGLVEKESLVLRPTSEVVFYEWYRKILQSYHQLPFLHNQWCSVFRVEKNTNSFFRSSEFY